MRKVAKIQNLKFQINTLYRFQNIIKYNTLNSVALAVALSVDDIARAVIVYEIYQTSSRRV